MKKKQKHSNDRFTRNCVRLFFGILASGGLVLGLLWGFLAVYESHTANAALNRFVHQLEQQDYAEIIANAHFPEGQTPAAADQTEQYLRQLYAGDLSGLSFVQRSADSRKREYNIMNNGRFIATMSLEHPSSSSKKWNAHLDLERKEFYIYAPSGTQVKVNGHLLTEEQLRKQAVPATYQGMKNRSQAPLADLYKVSDFVQPVIELEGGEASMIQSYPEDDIYCVLKKAAAADLETQRQAIEKAARTYANYISEDAAFSQLKQLMDTNTDFYKALSTFSNRFFSDHDSYDFRDIKIGDFYQYTENDFIGTISFNYVTAKGEQEQVYATHYRMSFVKQQNQWKLINLEVL